MSYLRRISIATILGLFALFIPRANAQTCTVTDNSDSPSDTGSLRYCVNNAISGEIINFSNTLTGQTITLNPASLPLRPETNITIQGPGANFLTISGGNARTVFLNDDSSATVNISGLTIANGNAQGGQGGGIANFGTLIVSNCTFFGNISGGGGGIVNASGATLTVNNSTFSENTAAGYGGGGIANLGGTVTVNNSTFSGNSSDFTVAGDGGGGIKKLSGTLSVSNSTLSGNSTTEIGGGVSNLSGTVTLSNSVVAGNTTAGVLGSDDCDGCGAQSSYNLIGGIPRLAPLGWYGGSTQTMIPLLGSPALGTGQVTASDDPSTDQRGFYRPSTTGATISLGAVQPNYLVVIANNDSNDASPGCDSAGDGPCSLRDAITLANTGNNTEGTDIIFTSGVGTISIGTVNGPLPAVTGGLDLVGAGPNNFTVSGDGSTSVGSIFTVSAGGDGTFSGVAIIGGNSRLGGGIFNAGVLVVSNVEIFDNTAVQYGGGIYNQGTMTLTNSTVSYNDASQGGGIFNNFGTLAVNNSTVSGNAASASGAGGRYLHQCRRADDEQQYVLRQLHRTWWWTRNLRLEQQR